LIPLTQEYHVALVAGVDSSTQSCKVVIRDARTGQLLRRGVAEHPPGTEIDPEQWWAALRRAIDSAGGLADVSAVSIAAQQHGLICLDVEGEVIRPALLWNDTRSAAAADSLIRELGGGDPEYGSIRWAKAAGSVPVASFTITKLRWLADHEPESCARIAAIALPHDWLTWKLSGSRSLNTLTTDRSDASGTGYFDAVSNEYRPDLLALALRCDEDAARRIQLPTVLGPNDKAGSGDPASGLDHVVLGPGCGDNAGAALGLSLGPGQTSISIGTSGVVASVSDTPTADATGAVAGFADATGRFLPLACTLNGARILDAAARVLGVDHAALSSLALAAAPGAGGLVHVPYLEGERTPNLPNARGELHGMSQDNLTRENFARAAVEGLLSLLGCALDGLREQGVAIERVCLLGGGARSAAVRSIAPTVLGVPVDWPTPGEYVADGAARQAAWVLSGESEPPHWPTEHVQTFTAPPIPAVTRQYRAAALTVQSRTIRHP
jgi:xylulokinase